MSVDNSLSDRQPHPQAFCFSRNKGLKYVVCFLRINAASGICHANNDPVVAMCGGRHMETFVLRVFHRFDRVNYYIEQYLLELHATERVNNFETLW